MDYNTHMFHFLFTLCISSILIGTSILLGEYSISIFKTLSHIKGMSYAMNVGVSGIMHILCGILGIKILMNTKDSDEI